jgi:REP element-mobilizing transposase RayT
MTYNTDIHHRRSIRLKEYDYSRMGAYFVTICAWNRECVFWEITEGKVAYSDAGAIIEDVWNGLPVRFPSIEVDDFVIMPNHIHGIVILNAPVGAGLALPGKGNEPKHKQKGAASGAPTLGNIVRTFKSVSTVTENRRRDRQGFPLWQRNYYEHIIRDEREFIVTCKYIRYNPLKWHEDEENPNMKRTE